MLVVLASLAAAIGIVVGLGVVAERRLRRRFETEVETIYENVHIDRGVVMEDELLGLPAPVARWLRRSGIVGRRHVNTGFVRQRGGIHASPRAPSMPFEAEEHFTVEQPRFLWWVKARMCHVLPFFGRDRFDARESEMRVSLGPLDLAVAHGPLIEEAAMQRYLAEVVWFPSAALRPYIHWSPMDDRHALATMTSHGRTASVAFAFDDRDRPLAISCDRFFGTTGRRARWDGRNLEWRVVDGVEIPVRGRVTWHLGEGDFDFLDWQVERVQPDYAARRR